MYRHSAQINVARSSLPSPAPEDSSDSESEINAELDEKRRDFDDEITRFKLQKDKEFYQFEKDLRSKRKTQRSRSRDTQGGKNASITSAVSGLFAGKQTRVNGVGKASKAPDCLLSPKIRPNALPSQPTVSLDKLTINGTTTPPTFGTPPYSKSLSRSPSNPSSLSFTPPRGGSIKSPIAEKLEKDFPGIIVPTYIPLLDARGSSLPGGRIASPQPTRSLTAPVVPSTSLPSALRTASGTTIKKRKHVTFQLADSAIVEPSSSYEETSSPQKEVSTEKVDDLMNEAAGNNGSPTSRSPTAEKSPMRTDFKGGLTVADDGGSGVGFFELDEELDDLDDREVDYHEVGVPIYAAIPRMLLIHLQDLDDDTHKSSDRVGAVQTRSEPVRVGSVPIDIVRPGSFRNSSVLP